MKANFSKTQILSIAVKVRQYKKLYVTTEGQMFKTEVTVEDAVRTKNQIIAEPSDFVGYIVVSEDMVSNEKLAIYGKNVEAFNDLFKDAKLPRTKKTEPTETRKREKPATDDAKLLAELESALGIAPVEEETEKKPEEKTEEKKPATVTK